MNQQLSLLFLLIAFSHFNHLYALEKVSISFTGPSSQAWGKAVLNRDDITNCQVSVWRPNVNEQAQSHPENHLECISQDNKRLYIDLSSERVAHWGNRNNTRSFEIEGELTTKFVRIFMEMTKGKPDFQAEDEIWSRISLCEPNGSYCLENFFLSESFGPLSPGQVACKRNSELREDISIEGIEPIEFQQELSQGDKIFQMVESEIQKGQRVITDLKCVFL